MQSDFNMGAGKHSLTNADFRMFVSGLYVNLPRIIRLFFDSAAAGQARIYDTCCCGRLKTIRGFSHDSTHIWEVYCRCAQCYCLPAFVYLGGL